LFPEPSLGTRLLSDLGTRLDSGTSLLSDWNEAKVLVNLGLGSKAAFRLENKANLGLGNDATWPGIRATS